jgi:ribosomal protein L37E
MAHFQNRRLIIATMHHKDKVLAPALVQGLGVACFVDPTLDTDLLGTFSGEVERAADPVTTLRNKCLMAMDKNHCDLVVATEGSFGPHPLYPFVHAHEEWMMLLDKAHDLEILVRTLSTQTNFNAAQVSDYKDLKDFADKAGFPDHGLILRKNKQGKQPIYKGIRNSTQLKDHFEELLSQPGEVWVETDMRALHNPTRMKVISGLAQELIARACSLCPQCQRPGYAVEKALQGLPCSQCGLPTPSALAYTHRCAACGFAEDKARSDGKTHEDPQHCLFCNP